MCIHSAHRLSHLLLWRASLLCNCGSLIVVLVFVLVVVFILFSVCVCVRSFLLQFHSLDPGIWNINANLHMLFILYISFCLIFQTIHPFSLLLLLPWIACSHWTTLKQCVFICTKFWPNTNVYRYTDSLVVHQPTHLVILIWSRQCMRGYHGVSSLCLFAHMHDVIACIHVPALSLFFSLSLTHITAYINKIFEYLIQ